MARQRTTDRRRLTPEDRERQIVQSAIAFYAEHGFGGQTRELAKRIGISQSLIFRYFPTKEDLITRVYQDVFDQDWNLDYGKLRDRTKPLEERLVAFYQEYSRLILGRDYARLLLYAALHQVNFHDRLFSRVAAEIYPAVIAELRAHFGGPSIKRRAPTRMEIETVWGLHAAIFFLGMREHVFALPVPATDEIIALKIKTFLSGIHAIMASK